MRFAFRPRLEALDDRWLPSTLTVTSPLDMDLYGETLPGTLRAAVEAAQSGDTIDFDPSLAGQTIALNVGAATFNSDRELFINTNLTIQGLPTGTTIDGGLGSRVFEVTAGATVTLNDLTIQHGDGMEGDVIVLRPHDGDGGGILNLGTLTLNGCAVGDNLCNLDGGGIYNAGTLTVNNGIISGNMALRDGDGGGILNSGPLFTHDSGGTVSILDSKITGNGARDGGGVANFGAMTLDGSAVSGNTARGSDLGIGRGGGVYNGGKLTATNCAATENYAGDIGGGIYNDTHGTLTLNFCTVAGNTSGETDQPDDLFNVGHVHLKQSAVG